MTVAVSSGSTEAIRSSTVRSPAARIFLPSSMRAATVVTLGWGEPVKAGSITAMKSILSVSPSIERIFSSRAEFSTKAATASECFRM
jgi:hypothetical protein